MFNELEYTDLISSGQLRVLSIKERHLTMPEAKQMPRCTVGQFLRYIDTQGHWVAEIYQYLRPDGLLGASGKPDPKRLRINGTVYALEPD